MDSSFSDDIVARVKSSADIVEIVEKFIRLKKSGSRWVGVCPFHDDTNPSLYVTPSMGIFKCFACGTGGDVIEFVKKHENLEFMEALQYIASQTGITLPAKLGGSREKSGYHRSLTRILSRAKDWYANNLEHNPEVRQYLQNRGIDDKCLKDFQLGYSPRGWDTLLKAAKKSGASEKELLDTGLAIRNPAGRIYDRFRGRLMFPIWNLSGHVVGFGGRVLDDSQPKYLNSPETNLYHKSRVLYGIHLARPHIEKQGFVIVVEGYMDVISLHSKGLQNTVSVSGTALTKEQVKILSRFCEKVVLFFDGDNAGQTAARRCLEPLVEHGLEIKVALLPSQSDPDSYVTQHGAEKVKQLFDASPGLDEFLTLGFDLSRATPESKDRLYKQCLGLLQKIPSDLVREEYLNKIRNRLDIRLNTRPAPARPSRPASAPDLTQERAKRLLRFPEAQLLHVLFSDEKLCWLAMETIRPEWLLNDFLREMVDLLFAHVEENGKFIPGAFVASLDDRGKDLIMMLEMSESIDSGSLKKKFMDLAYALELRFIRNRMRFEKDLENIRQFQKKLKELHKEAGNRRTNV